MQNHCPLPLRSPVFAHGQASHAPTQSYYYGQVTDFLSETVRLTPHRDFTTRSAASDILSIYAYGISEALPETGELSARQAKQLACELFVFHFGWATAEAAVRVNALGSAASDPGSPFAPMIEAGGKAFFSWRLTRDVPEKVSFYQACAEMDRLHPLPASIREEMLNPESALLHGGR